MSELSTVAIKDGHRGHNPYHNSRDNPSASHSVDAERADRISRLAGLERVTTARGNNNASSPLNPALMSATTPVQSYFDASGNPALHRERSTVGSASATGSVGARTTWAGSEAESNADRMSDVTGDFNETGSLGGMSEDAGSLVGFGEGARTPARHSVYGTPARTPRAQQGEGMDGVVMDREGMNTTSQDRMDGHNEGSPQRRATGREK